MIQFRLVWVGRENKRDPESMLCDRYLDRIARYIKLETRVIKPVVGGKGTITRQKESEKILAGLAPGDFLILCDERGKQLSSAELARLLNDLPRRGANRATFVVGGAMGVSEALRQKADFVVSLSRMTLPHALARVVLTEQIYRALCIQARHPYHHEG